MVYVEACGCTQACRHCAVDGKPPYGGFYSLAELRDLQREWGPLVPYYEPTVHPEFPEIMFPEILGEGTNMLATNGFGLIRRDDQRMPSFESRTRNSCIPAEPASATRRSPGSNSKRAKKQQVTEYE